MQVRKRKNKGFDDRIENELEMWESRTIREGVATI